jgi:hypothetical protein
MAAAGIGPGPVRDELEGHLIETADALVKSGCTESEAFAMAETRLGAGERLREEYNIAVPRKTPLWTAFSIFPANHRLVAWGTVAVGIHVLLATLRFMTEVGRLYRNGDLPFDVLKIDALAALLIVAVSLRVLWVGAAYLRQPGFARGSALASTWSVIFWICGSALAARFIRQATNLDPFPAIWNLVAMAACYLAARFLYARWRLHLLGNESAPPKLGHH